MWYYTCRNVLLVVNDLQEMNQPIRHTPEYQVTDWLVPVAGIEVHQLCTCRLYLVR